MAQVGAKVGAVGLVAVVTLSLSGCGGGDSGGAPDGKKKQAAEKPAAADPKGMGLEMKGANGAVLTIDSVQRFEGGVVTVHGEMRNEGKAALNPDHWTGGNDLSLKNGYSSSGASLADLKGKKRYYPLRDTQGNCLCNRFHTVFQPGDTAPVFVQFPAPPEGTTEVDFAMPTFGTAPVKITVAQ
ncbi:hypothetical protein OG883_42220 [Streptomyces sp. NBC_01142]|uniref:hypothetical protein n=1 Tax=Streptomyces sp. NBC_01142 TaxID=2975865 RepID=UPI002256E84D|nr:hypothetical protein [Streptomyces sp. NBC_01142]MCX4826267.1 hypothetical protein [Streptomyces sp. NBC_01142]